MSHPFERIPVGWARGLVFALLFSATILLGSLTNVELKPRRMAYLELAGSQKRAAEVIDAWQANGCYENALTLQTWDDYFLIFYPLTLSLLCVIVADVYGDFTHKLGLWLAWLALVAGILDFVENRAINQMLTGHFEGWPQLSLVCAAPKFLILFACFLFISGGVVARFSLLKPPALK